jgi:hypothetical protein
MREDICLPRDVKETFFFDRRFEKGLDWYEYHFQSCSSGEVRHIIEVGPSYFHSPQAPERIKNVLGDIPLIVVFRNPVNRSFSHFVHLRQYGFTSLPLREALDEYPEIIEASKYARQLNRWMAFHSSSNIILLRHETMRETPDIFVRKLNDFLNLPHVEVPKGLRGPVNRSVSSKSNRLMGIAWRFADYLRGKKLHTIVEAAKRAGLKKLIMNDGGDESSIDLSRDDKIWLYRRLRDDMSILNSKFNIKLFSGE